MAGRDPSVIELEYEKLVEGLVQEELGSASIPLSATITCFPELGEAACVTRSIKAVKKGDQDFVCTEGQASELGKIWNAAFSASKSEQLADDALAKRLRAMRAQMAKAIPQSDC